MYEYLFIYFPYVIRKKKHFFFFFFFFFKSDYNRSGEYMDLFQLPSYNHVHYTIVDFNGLDIGVYCHATLSKHW